MTESNPIADDPSTEKRISSIGVTVVVPSYLRGAKIEATLNSIQKQTRQPNEVIVVNDGSFQGTTDYVKDNFPSIRVIDIPHGGAALARNTGVQNAANPIVVLIDDDDIFRPEGVETLLKTLLTFPEARSAHGDNSYTHLGTGEHRERNIVEIEWIRNRLAKIQPLRIHAAVRLYGKALYYEMLRGNIIQQPWAVYRDAYLAVGGFQAGLVSADDWDLYLRIARRFPVALTDELVGHHFTEPGRPHLTLDPRQIEGQIEAGERQLKLAGWCDFKAIRILRKKLSGQYKFAGDQKRSSDLWVVWKCYSKSLLLWPFDAVVVVRTLVVLPAQIAQMYLVRSQKQRKLSETSCPKT